MALADDIINGRFNKKKNEEETFSIADSIINGTFNDNSTQEIKKVEPTMEK